MVVFFFFFFNSAKFALVEERRLPQTLTAGLMKLNRYAIILFLNHYIQMLFASEILRCWVPHLFLFSPVLYFILYCVLYLVQLPACDSSVI